MPRGWVAAIAVAGLMALGPVGAAFAEDAPVASTTSTDSAATPASADPTPAPAEATPAPTATAVPAPAAAPAPAPTAAPAPAPAPTATTPSPAAAFPKAAVSTKTSQPSDSSEPKKVFVCKAVGTPGVNERWQTGNNPLSTAIEAIKNWGGTVGIGGWFADAQGRSFVLAYDIGQPKPSLSDCIDAAGPLTPTCVSDAQWSYTLDYATMSGTVTVTGGETAKAGDKLCDGLAVRAAKRAYTTESSVWPQGPATYNDTLVDTVGTFAYSVPNWTNQCGQADIYAQWVSKGGFDALVLSDALYGPQNPKEPPFLHEILSGKGPVPTYKATSAEGCNVPQPVTVTGKATFKVRTCDVESQNWISAEAVPGGIWSISDGNGHTQDLAGIGEGYENGLPDGLAYGTTYTVSLRDGNSEDLYTVTPWEGTWTPVDAANSPSCWPTDAYAHVDVATQATCDANSSVEFLKEHAKWNDPSPDLSVGDHTRTATADQGHLFPAEMSVGSTTMEVAYTIKPALGHQSTDANAPCYVKPPVVTPPAPKPPVVVPQPPAAPAAAVSPQSSQSLAHTGSNLSNEAGLLWFVGIALALGSTLWGASAILGRRRKATNE